MLLKPGSIVFSFSGVLLLQIEHFVFHCYEERRKTEQEDRKREMTRKEGVRRGGREGRKGRQIGSECCVQREGKTEAWGGEGDLCRKWVLTS